MEKKLMLLGILRGQDMHGYSLNEHLGEKAGMAISLKKSNAYSLLGKMEKDGWVTHHEEREGNRPIRRVYSITPEGEEAFQGMLRESLMGYPAPEFPSLVALSLIDVLLPEEAVSLLRKRGEKIEARLEGLHEVNDQTLHPHDLDEASAGHEGSVYLGLEFLGRYYTAELELIEEIIERLENQKGGKEH